jgi:hypothetical protein
MAIRWARLVPLTAFLSVASVPTARGDLALVGSELQINSETLIAAEVFPSVGAFPNGDFVVTWSENVDQLDRTHPLRAEVMARRFSSSGEPLDHEFQVNTFTTGWQGWPVVDTWPGGFVIAWESDPLSPGSSPQFGGFRRYDASGTPLDDESRFDDVANDPVVAADPDGGFAVAYFGFSVAAGRSGLMARRFDRDATPRGDAVFVSNKPKGGEFPALAVLADGGLVVAFQTFEPAGIAARRFDETGAPSGEVFPVSEVDQGREPEVVSQPDGGFVVVWTRSGDLVGRRFTATGSPAGSEFPVSDRSTAHFFPGPREVASDLQGGFVLVEEAARCEETGIIARHFDSVGATAWRRDPGRQLRHGGTGSSLSRC